MLSEHLGTIQRVCFALEPSDTDLVALGDAQRWRMYREMVRARLFKVIRAALPRTSEAVGKELFDEAISRWLAEQGPHTPYYRDVALEFADWWLVHNDAQEWLRALGT